MIERRDNALLNFPLAAGIPCGFLFLTAQRKINAHTVASAKAIMPWDILTIR